MPTLWRFRCYVSARGVDEIKTVYEAEDLKVQARFLSRLRTLSALPEREWHEGYFKKLSGNCEGLGEIRFKANGVQQRPLGFKSGPHEFTILFWAREKNGRFVPHSACKQSLRRKAEVVADRSRTNALWLALE